jgi:sporulation protein YlmC with PRC-barrel domain
MTHTLVPSDRIEGASVYGRDGERIGTIERLMLDKVTGMVAYAVVKCGGLLSGDRHYYPLPWTSLRFDAARKAYEAASTLEELRGGQCELDSEVFDWGDRSPVYRHPQYWTV